MKQKITLNEVVETPDFLCESGSHLYGTNISTSDYDLRGFVLPPFEYLIGIKNFNSIDLEGDHKIFSTKYFLELALKGDPQIVELFFANEKNVKHISALGKQIISLKEHILSNAIFNRVMGFSNSEWRKAMAIKIEPKKMGKEKKDVINEIRNFWNPSKEIMDSIIKSLEDIDDNIVVSSFSGLGEKRKKDIEEYGFCRKSASHAIRLVRQVNELMMTGSIIFPRPDAQTLLDIKKGLFSKKDVEEIYIDSLNETEKNRSKSVLPDKPNSKIVWEKYEDLVFNVVNGLIFNIINVDTKS